MKKIKFMKDKSELFSKKNVISCYSGHKTVDGKETDQKCLVVGVQKKIALNQLNEEDIIPDVFNGQKTDVLEVPIMRAGHCADGEGLTKPSVKNSFGCLKNVVKDDNKPFRCLPAGSSIGINTDHSAGTLGFFAVDENNELCGVTNNHVALNTGYYPKHQAPIHIFLREYIIEDSLGLSMNSVTKSYQGHHEYGFGFNFTFNGDSLDGGLFEVGRTYVFHLDDLNMNGKFYLLLDDGSKYTESKIAEYPPLFDPTSDPENSYTLLQDVDDNDAYNYISGNQSLIVTYYPDQHNFSKLNYYYKKPNGESYTNEINYFYYGVPHCHLKDKSNIDPTDEYSKNEPSPKNLNKYKSLVTPSNIESSHLNSGTKFIGKVKYSEPLYFEHKYNYGTSSGDSNEKGLQATPINYIDACAFTFSKEVCPSNETIGLTTSYQEMEYSPNVGDYVYKSGRTTGVTPPEDLPDSQKPKIISTDWSGYVTYCSNFIQYEGEEPQQIESWQHYAYFEDCLYYKGEGVWFSDSGDSGSGVYIDSDSQKKLAALHFGGAADVSINNLQERSVISHGIGSKILNVLDGLHLSPWNGKRSLPQSIVGDKETITICGETFQKSSNQEQDAGISPSVFED